MRIFRSSHRNASDLQACKRSFDFASSRLTVLLLVLLTTITVLSLGVQQARAADAQVDSVLKAQAAVDAAAAKSQKRIDDLTSRTEDAAAKYAQVLAQAKSYERYNEKLNEQVVDQRSEMASIQRQLKGVQSTARQIQPLMEKMVASLAQFVALDLPFLPEERAQRVRRLQNLLTRVDVSISEKYRQIMQAYMIELGYGHTLGAYKGTLGQGKDARTVQFVRVGRVTLMYQSLDGGQTGYWDAVQHKWVVDNDYAGAFRTALKMANKKGTPELLTVPVPVPREATP